MADLIDRQAVLQVLEKSLTFCKSELWPGEYRKGCIAAIKDDIGNVKHIPAVDAVPVVRCKDCKHGGRCEMECLMRDIDEIADPFCAAGERREENGRNI